jgi:hypothetical protein
MPKKPIIFLSHSSQDGHIANTLKREIESVIDVEVFETSHFDAIPGGEKWFQVITQKLDESDALFVLASYNSRNSIWVHWETGYFHKRNTDEGNKMPVYVATVAGEKPFSTISDSQAKSLNDSNETGVLLRSLGDNFGIKVDLAVWQHAIEAINQIAPIRVADESALEKLRDYFVHDYKSGRWIDYQELDRSLSILPDMTKANLKSVITVINKKDNLILKIIEEKEDGVRLSKDGRVTVIEIPNLFGH